MHLMDIVSVTSIIGLVVIIIVMILRHENTILTMKTIEKARDVQEIKEYIFPETKKSPVEEAEPLKDLESLSDEDIAKITNSANAKR